MGQDSEKLIEDDRTFFCSELVAKAYKFLGIIEDDDINCATIYPHHFSALGEDGLNLTQGTHIEEEM